MKEDFLHHIWQYKKFELSNLKTANGEVLTIFNSGQYTQKSGPDFFNAQISIDHQKWAGNIEIHIQSSDWYVHHHETDLAYDNVILHVVWEHNASVYRKNNTEIPVLILKNYVANEVVANYKKLMQPKSWILCEKEIKNIPHFVMKNWQDRLFFDRLEQKSKAIENLLEKTNNDWEWVLICLLAKNFGLNTNGAAFMEIVQNISFSIIRKESTEVENLEALFYGFAGLLEQEKEDHYYKDLQIRYYYLLQKYPLDKTNHFRVEFFKHRPDNFPTIRLSQLANLYHHQNNLFSKIIQADTIEKIHEVLAISASNYWDNHYNFDNQSIQRKKKLSRTFIDLISINTIVPLQFVYAKKQNKEISDQFIALLSEIESEKNAIIEKFKENGIESKSAFESQTLLQLKNEYCNKKRCMECAVGIELIKS
jgi:Protein of unknown function (DUF2851)